MITVLTICSANYLAHAKVLGNSLAQSSAECHFVIGLVDRVPAELPPDYWYPFELIPVEDLRIPKFEGMAWKYNIIELNTAVKPFFMEHLYKRNQNVSSVIYLDPDILVFGSFKSMLEKLRSCNILVTPHSCTYDNSLMNVRYEISMLCTGIYNLGFVATSRTETTFAFLKWWQERVRDHSYHRPGSGVFTDQLWVTLAPLYFPGIEVETDPGYNMCYWNHFERRLSIEGGHYIVNGKHDLVFYHFSSYSPLKPDSVSSRPNEMVGSFAERPDLRSIYDDYRNRLMAAGYATVSSLKYAFDYKEAVAARSFKGRTKAVARFILGVLPSAIQKTLNRLAHFTVYCCSK